MYEAKAAGRRSCAFFEPRMQELLDEQMALATDLREALGSGDLTLVYQPQVGRRIPLSAPKRCSAGIIRIAARSSPLIFLALAEPIGWRR